jgi:hypothetical protein
MPDACDVPRPTAGLCDRCVHQRLVPNTRGSVFSLCERSRAEPEFPRYPRLPVTGCRGYEPRGGGARIETMPDDPSTAALRAEQLRRESEERAGERSADEPEEELAHRRRAEKAGYLREKLTERAASERDDEEETGDPGDAGG